MWGWFYGEDPKTLMEAAHTARAEREWVKAIDTYVKAGDLLMKAGEEEKGYECYRNATRIGRYAGFEASKIAFQRTAAYYTKKGKFECVASVRNALAQIAQEEGKYEEALDLYTRAAEMWEDEGNFPRALKARKSMTRLLALRGDWKAVHESLVHRRGLTVKARKGEVDIHQIDYLLCVSALLAYPAEKVRERLSEIRENFLPSYRHTFQDENFRAIQEAIVNRARISPHHLSAEVKPLLHALDLL